MASVRGSSSAIVVLAVCLVAGCRGSGPANTAVASADPCAPPPAWNAPGVTPGHPDAELALCLKDAAFAARTVKAPVASLATGVVAQCEVEVDRFEGTAGQEREMASDQARQAADADAVAKATAAVTQYQGCR